MYYRYEARFRDEEWIGIFQAFLASEARKWHCLTVPKWYETHFGTPSKAYFTQHGYDKWRGKMERAIKDFHYGNNLDWEFRLVKVEKLDNIVVNGKTQVVVTI